MKKAVISTGGKQYFVTEGETLEVELLKQEGKATAFEPILVIDGDKTSIGKPFVKGVKVDVDIIEPEIKTDKTTAIRYKAKKRVRKVRGHRQRKTLIRIKQITATIPK
jgi:large subunit ribosomal protein L21